MVLEKFVSFMLNSVLSLQETPTSVLKPDLKKYMDKKLQIKLNANRVVVGTLRGFDQFMNLVIDNTVEVNGNEKNDIGMVVIRGNSVVMIEALEPVARTQ
ncbi:probable small nuclear ribonucleoprotein G isoform X1 [Typha angustifolia]|uniref:probable small nuclear ribonucleoprotein G isoform X1 n=1 Tax=Typha angustifolia TaxID=59011 RepID=UPI003C2DD686